MAVSRGCRALLGILNPTKMDEEESPKDAPAEPPPASRYDPVTSIKKDAGKTKATVTLTNVRDLTDSTAIRVVHPEDDSENKLRVEVPSGELIIFCETLPGEVIKDKTEIQRKVKDRRIIITLKKAESGKWLEAWSKIR